MDPQIVEAILGVGGAIGGSAIAVYRDEIKNFILRTKDHDYLRGAWQCDWDITSHPTATPNHIVDQVKITMVNSRLLRGEASTPKYGKWSLEGKATQFAVTLSYSGENTMSDMVGVVILKKESPTKLNGVWCQYTVDGSLKSGTTSWEKIP